MSSRLPNQCSITSCMQSDNIIKMWRGAGTILGHTRGGTGAGGPLPHLEHHLQLPALQQHPVVLQRGHPRLCLLCRAPLILCTLIVSYSVLAHTLILCTLMLCCAPPLACAHGWSTRIRDLKCVACCDEYRHNSFLFALDRVLNLSPPLCVAN